MKRRIFASKDSSGYRIYLKFLLWAAIGLVVLVLFIPLTSHQKAGKEALKRPSSERGGVVREIPKTLQPVAESLSRGQEGPSGTPKTADSKPGTDPDGKAAGQVTESAQQAALKEKPAEAPTALPQKAEPAPDATPKKTVGPPGPPESTGAGQVAKEAQPAPKPDDAVNKEGPASPKKPAVAAPPITGPNPKAVASAPAPARVAKSSAADSGGPVGTPAVMAPDSRKTAPSDGRKMYAVQIAALKDKNSAEELKKTLHKKGFDAIVKVTGDPKQGQTYALQLQPVDDIGKASTLMEQVKYVPQAKPTIITVPAGR